MLQKNILRMDLNLLKVFDAIYTNKHLTRAGENIFMTQPAMSHALRRLRYSFDDELFIRTPKGMVPTDFADRLAPLITNGLRELQAALDSSSDFDPTTASREFTVAVDEYGSMLVIPRLISTMRPVAPGISINTMHVGAGPHAVKGSERAIYDYLDIGEIDMAIMSRHDHPPRFEEGFLYSEPAVCVVSENNTEVGDKMDIETYVSMGHVKAYLESDDDATVVDQALAKVGHKRNIVVSLPHLAAALSTVEKSDLVATVPLRVAKSLGSIAKLRFLDAPLEIDPTFIVLVWHKRWDKSAASKWLREMITECCVDL